MNTPTTERRAFSVAEVAFLIGVPLAWAVRLWFHPDVPDPDNVHGGLRDEVTTYQIVHVGTLVFIGLMGVALYVLVRDLPGKAATITRLAIGPFVVFYSAWETVIGLATGALVQQACRLALAPRLLLRKRSRRRRPAASPLGPQSGHACPSRVSDPHGCDTLAPTPSSERPLSLSVPASRSDSALTNRAGAETVCGRSGRNR